MASPYYTVIFPQFNATQTNFGSLVPVGGDKATSSILASIRQRCGLFFNFVKSVRSQNFFHCRGLQYRDTSFIARSDSRCQARARQERTHLRLGAKRLGQACVAKSASLWRVRTKLQNRTREHSDLLV